MAEVLKKGDRDVCLVGDYECTGKGNKGRGCGAILRIRTRDLYQTVCESYDDREYFITFVCPECATETDVKSEHYYNVTGHYRPPGKKEWLKNKKKN